MVTLGQRGDRYLDYELLVCRDVKCLKYGVIKERVRFLETLIVGGDEGRGCIGGGSGGGRMRSGE